MNTKFIWLGLFVGSTVGGLIPALWGDSALSFTSIILSAIGGIVGIYYGYRLSE